MAFRTWDEANEALAQATSPATKRQQEMGKMAKQCIPPQMPRIVAAAIIRGALADELNLPTPRPVGEWFEKRLEAVRQASDPEIAPETEEEADAWIIYLRLLRRKECLAELRINQGDIVRTANGEFAEVSSIGLEGRVFFKGGQGFGSWPDLISIVARSHDGSAEAKKAKRQAENSAARHKTASNWSMARSLDLAEFVTSRFVSNDYVDELEAIISSAQDERPIQEFLQENRFLLTALLGGKDRYCLSQERLGREYVPDFVIGDADSLGFRWVLVELETPQSGIYVKNGLDLDSKARKGVSQVVSWRDWLSDNIAYARQRRSENGLGLFDIREKAEALVLVGRRNLMPKTKDAQRYEYRQANNIQIHTNDWLLDTLHGIIEHSGPPASNPFLIPRRIFSDDL